MSNTTNQAATNRVPTPSQDLRSRLERSLEIAGQPADRATINRIVSSNNRPQPTTTVKGSFQPKPFSLPR